MKIFLLALLGAVALSTTSAAHLGLGNNFGDVLPSRLGRGRGVLSRGGVDPFFDRLGNSGFIDPSVVDPFGKSGSFVDPFDPLVDPYDGGVRRGPFSRRGGNRLGLGRSGLPLVDRIGNIDPFDRFVDPLGRGSLLGGRRGLPLLDPLVGGIIHDPLVDPLGRGSLLGGRRGLPLLDPLVGGIIHDPLLQGGVLSRKGGRLSSIGFGNPLSSSGGYARRHKRSLYNHYPSQGGYFPLQRDLFPRTRFPFGGFNQGFNNW